MEGSGHSGLLLMLVILECLLQSSMGHAAYKHMGQHFKQFYGSLILEGYFGT
jgi:hypothetical protein